MNLNLWGAAYVFGPAQIQGEFRTTKDCHFVRAKVPGLVLKP